MSFYKVKNVHFPHYTCKMAHLSNIYDVSLCLLKRTKKKVIVILAWENKTTSGQVSFGDANKCLCDICRFSHYVHKWTPPDPLNRTTVYAKLMIF